MDDPPGRCSSILNFGKLLHFLWEAQITTEQGIAQLNSALEVQVPLYIFGFCVRFYLRKRYAPGPTDIYCERI